MSSTTTNLNLYKADPIADGDDTFNIEKMLNENWEKIDKSMEEVKKSVSDGKTAVATAITDKGVTTATDATFATMAANIQSIASLEQETADATAVAGDIVAGKTAYAHGEKVIGTLPEAAAITECQSITLSSNYFYVRFPQGAYRTNASSGHPEIQVPQGDFVSAAGLTAAKILNGQSVCGVAGTATADATATAAQILSGKTAYVKGNKITGTIPSKGAATITPGTTNKTIAAGQYLSGTQTIVGSANLKAENIKQGVNIMGIIGSCISLTNSIFKYLDYDLTSGGTANISVTGKIVCIFTTNKSGTVPILFPGIGYVDTSEYGWVDETALSFTYRWDNYANTVKYSINSDLKSGTINTLNFRGEAIYRVLYLA